MYVSGQKCPFWLPYPHRTTDRTQHFKVHTKEYKTHPICTFNVKNKNGSYKYKNVDTADHVMQIHY
jgi:hypothetical protein